MYQCHAPLLHPFSEALGGAQLPRDPLIEAVRAATDRARIFRGFECVAERLAHDSSPQALAVIAELLASSWSSNCAALSSYMLATLSYHSPEHLTEVRLAVIDRLIDQGQRQLAESLFALEWAHYPEQTNRQHAARILGQLAALGSPAEALQHAQQSSLSAAGEEHLYEIALGFARLAQPHEALAVADSIQDPVLAAASLGDMLRINRDTPQFKAYTGAHLLPRVQRRGTELLTLDAAADSSAGFYELILAQQFCRSGQEAEHVLHHAHARGLLLPESRKVAYAEACAFEADFDQALASAQRIHDANLRLHALQAIASAADVQERPEVITHVLQDLEQEATLCTKIEGALSLLQDNAELALQYGLPAQARRSFGKLAHLLEGDEQLYPAHTIALAAGYCRLGAAEHSRYLLGRIKGADVEPTREQALEFIRADGLRLTHEFELLRGAPFCRDTLFAEMPQLPKATRECLLDDLARIRFFESVVS